MKSLIKKVTDLDEYEVYLYTPTLTKPFYVNLEPISFRKRIRFLIAYFAGYKVFYLFHMERIIGYCLVQNGRDPRYRFASKRDVIVGPYFIIEEYRGRKLSIKLLKYILQESGLNFENAYDYIHKENIPSIKASQAVGFKYMCDANVTKFMRRLKTCKNGGEYAIFRFTKSQH